MLLVDYRAGSKELIAPLRRMGLDAVEGDIAADIAFEGRGEKGAPVLIGLEYKKLGELMQSLRTQRLQGHQLLKMRDTFTFSYLLIEGELLYDTKGRLLKRVGRRQFRLMPGAMTAMELLKRLHVLNLRGGLMTLTPFARTQAETCMQIAALYRVWTDRDLDQHKSHIAIYQAPTLTPISEFRQIVKGFNGIGIKTSKAIEDCFRGSLRKAANAPRAKWEQIDGISAKLAAHIDDVLEGVDYER